MKNLILFALVFLPVVTFAAEDGLPAFPMSFWGEVTIDGMAAPVGSTVRVYEGDTKVGQVVVKESGVYGYIGSTAQKLVVEESDGVLDFTIQAASINGGVETKGLVAITYPEFKSGEAVNKDLAFSVTAPVPPVVVEEPKKKSSGGGGGGKSNKVKAKLPTTELVLGVSTSTASATGLSEAEKTIVLQKQLISLLSQLIVLLQMKMGV
jgi:hypothetical protein